MQSFELTPAARVPAVARDAQAPGVVPPDEPFELLQIAPLVFVETTSSGEQVRHQAYQAHVTAYSRPPEAEMVAFAWRIFTDRLRVLAEQDGKSQVWTTFYLSRPKDGERVKTFRVIYLRDGEGWRRGEWDGAGLRT